MSNYEHTASRNRDTRVSFSCPKSLEVAAMKYLRVLVSVALVVALVAEGDEHVTEKFA